MAIIGKSAQNLHSPQKFVIEVFGSILQTKWIDEAIQSFDRADERIRKLPMRFVTWMLVGMAFNRNLSIKNVLARLGQLPGGGALWEKPPKSAATGEARDRLGVAPIRLLLIRLREWILETHRKALSWRGWFLLALDGTTVKVPDSEENRRVFGLPGTNRGGRAAFPQVRVMLLVSVTMHFFLDVLFAPYRVGELSLAPRLASRLPACSLLLLDRAFISWHFLWSLTQAGHAFVLRLRRGVKLQRCVRLSSGDWLVRAKVPRHVRRWVPTMPKFIEYREVTVRVGKTYFRFLTSLTDSSHYSTDEIVHLYRQRWEAELAIDEFKTHQCNATTVNRPVIVRSKRPRRVIQELYALVLTFNLIRCSMAEAALRAKLDPLRVSFVDSLERLREGAIIMATAPILLLFEIYAQVLRALTRDPLPPREERKNRREVCIKMSAYPKKWKKAA